MNSSTCRSTPSRFRFAIRAIGTPAYTVQGSNSNPTGTKLNAPMATPSGMSFPGMTTEFAPTPMWSPKETSPVIPSAAPIMIASFTKSFDVHQTRTPAERLEKSPMENSRSGPPATEQPVAMCVQSPMRTRVEK